MRHAKTYTIGISWDHHEADEFCAWLNERGHSAEIGSTTVDCIDGTDVSTDERLQAVYNGLWDEYCNSDIDE